MLFKLLLISIFFLSGCGYTTRGYQFKESKIRVKPVVNQIRVAREARRYSDYTSYPILIEERLTNGLVAEFNIGSDLEVVSQLNDALELECVITDYRRQTLSYTDSDDPKEQRLRLRVKMKLTDSEGAVVLERDVVGQATFDLTDAADSETAAQNDLVEDTARRIREAVVELW